MDFGEFERAARDVWETIPEQYREGVDGLIVEEAVHANPQRADVYTLGECLTENYPSQYGGPDTIRSAVVLYYGSFREVAEDSVAFDWSGEIRETIMHELQHHLEALADEDALGDVDYAVNENFKRVDGEPFDLFFFRSGELLDANVYRVDCDIFVEVLTRDRAAAPYELDWDGRSYRVVMPATNTDVTFIELEGIPYDDGDFYVVRVVKRGAFATLRAVFRSGFTVSDAVARVERA
jgi:predicted Zn-dependent protease with MMP-like domain